ncbi:GntR family transcriptional regulator [Maritalea porphyrae]|uniref:GntR family transcriptional regulator n=1 Tax=Maritalea porphyrae TaxID=880732 RepID=UPI0022B05BE1|nr:GntR family transcriptional regulator [Maritalea porphyrae]MCZ4274158.1 GntR family transcriptional regulator [Maritalea porphyrae]
MKLIDEILQRLRRTSRTADPLYKQLAFTIRELIESGTLRGGEALPAERDLVTATGLSRITVRKAIEELLNDGLLSKRHGVGTFVSTQIDQPLSILLGFTADMQRRGAQSSSILLNKSVGLPNSSEVLKLGISPNEKVLRLSRVRLSEGEPLAVENATVPLYAVGQVDEMGESLYDALEKTSSKPIRALQRLHAAIANQEEARLLKISVGDPILHIERRSFLENGRPIEVTISAYRGDRYDFIAELSIER